MKTNIERTDTKLDLHFPCLVEDKITDHHVIVMAFDDADSIVVHSIEGEFVVGENWNAITSNARLFTGRVILEN